MVERKPPTKQVDSWNETVDSEVNACLTNTEALLEFYLLALKDFARNHDFSYLKSMRLENAGIFEAEMKKSDRKIHRLEESYTPTLRYLAELATGSDPIFTPSEKSVREMFGLLAKAPIGADDYIGAEINGKIRDRSLEKAALVHSGGSSELAEGYCNMSPSQPFLRKYRLSAKLQR